MKFKLNPFKRNEEKYYVMDKDKSPSFQSEDEANKYTENSNGNYKVVKEE